MVSDGGSTDATSTKLPKTEHGQEVTGAMLNKAAFMGASKYLIITFGHIALEKLPVQALISTLEQNAGIAAIGSFVGENGNGAVNFPFGSEPSDFGQERSSGRWGAVRRSVFMSVGGLGRQLLRGREFHGLFQKIERTGHGVGAVDPGDVLLPIPAKAVEP